MKQVRNESMKSSAITQADKLKWMRESGQLLQESEDLISRSDRFLIALLQDHRRRSLKDKDE